MKTPRSSFRPMLVLVLGLVTGAAVSLHMYRAATVEQQKVQLALHELAMIKRAISYYLIEWNGYPDSSKSATAILVSLKTPIQGGGPLLLNLWQNKGQEPKDPWDRKYCMLPGGSERPPIFYSSGPNGKDEGGQAGTDDVVVPEGSSTSNQVPKSSWLK